MKHLLYLPILCISLSLSQTEIDTLWTFTNCGQEGYTGPSQGQCEAEYLGTSLEGQVTLTEVAGIQEWTVPVNGIFTIESQGAMGGGSDGGSGAKMKGEFALIEGEILSIVVGQQGLSNTSDGGGGGGGGTFVYHKINENLLIAAGGGGGSNREEVYEPGLGGVTGLEGTGSCGGSGGTAGYCGGSDIGGPGAGWFDGDNQDYGGEGSCGADLVGAKSKPTWIGGEAYRHCSNNHGGFGGGGGGIHPGGGGGGYSGGSGNDGGGGGSYNSGTNQDNASGVNDGHGLVVITFIQGINIDHTPSNSSDIQGPYTITAEIVGQVYELESTSLFYSVNSGDFTEVSMLDNGDSTYTAEIPGQSIETRIDYYISVANSDGYTFNTEIYTFYITLVDDFTILSSYSRPDGTIDLYWEAPSYLDGVSPTNLSIYRSLSAGVTKDDLIAEVDISNLTYYDTDITPGNTYYYRIGATGDVDGETLTALISNETQVYSNPEAVVSISGQVNLEGTEDNGDVLIEFHRTNPTENFYTTTSSYDGSFEKEIPLGIYNISFTKEGWQPYELNGQYITGPTQYEPITLEQGYPAYVEGEVSGLWSNEYLYFIEGDITVPDGQTLTIEAGTRIKFTGEYQFGVEGVLIAEGDSLNHIEFISGDTYPEPGDWGILSLESPGNILRFVDIRHAGNGISGRDIDGSVFDNCTIADIPYWADDARVNCHGIEAENCRGCVFSNNSVDGDIWEGIMIEHNGSGSVFIGNMINTYEAMVGLAVGEGDSLIFSDNVIMTEGYGSAILVDEGSNISITDNIISGYKGIHVPFGSNLTITGNDITSINRGINIHTSGTNLTLSNNSINSGEISIANSGTDTGQIIGNICEGSSGDYAIEMSSCDDCLIEANTVNYPSGSGIRTNSSENTTISGNSLDINNYGIEADSGSDLDISDNDITGFAQYGIKFNSTGNSNVYDNTLVATPNYDNDNYGIYNSSNSHQNTVHNNNIHFLDGGNTVEGIRISRVDVHDNTIIFENGGSSNYGIRGENNTIFNNNISLNANSSNSYAIYSSTTSYSREIYGNEIELSGWASGIKGNQLHIHDNTMTGSGNLGIDITGNMEENTLIENNTVSGKVRISNYAVLDMHHNLVTSTTGGLEIMNYAGGHYYNNTFSGNSSGTGLYIHNFDEEAAGQGLIVENNIFSGFVIGVNLESSISSIRFNNVSGSDSLDFTGEGLPLEFGNANVPNSNGDMVDFYANLFINPEFVLPNSGNFNLQTISPCIDAGNLDMDGDGIDYQNDEDDQDPDGTAFDMGAFYRSINDTTDVFGCTDSIACNYIPGATQDNGGCTYATTWYWDGDGDGLGVEESTVENCEDEVPDNFVDNADDLEPDCATNDTDECGECGGDNSTCADCAGVPSGDNVADNCGTCDSDPSNDCIEDCNGEWGGDATIDNCGVCDTDPGNDCPEDCAGVDGGTAVWDDCGVCSGGNTEHEANSDIDCAGVCFGQSIPDNFEGCCLSELIDGCIECNGNGWDNCDDDGDGVGNYEQWGYGAHDLSITDVPDDQGGWVEVTFSRSYYDTDTLRSVEAYTVETNYGNGWMNSANGTAYGSDQYTYQVHTQVDSSAATDGMVDFRVIAGMEEGNFESETVSGYSVDNISPIIPNELMAEHSDNDVNINWHYEMENDFQYHQVASLIEAVFTIENNYEFTLVDGANNEHWVNAFDTHGNVSENSESLMSKSLHSGANLISINVLPEDLSIGEVLNSLEFNANGIIGEGTAATYLESGIWVGSLTQMNGQDGYWLMLDEEDILLIVGEPTERGVYELHAGANLISYPYRYPTPITDAIPDDVECLISGIIGEGQAATQLDCGFWVGSLNELEGSYGYWFMADEAIEFSFDGCDSQDCADLSRVAEQPASIPEGFEYTQSTRQAFYFFESIENIEIGDFVLSYNGDVIIGAREWTGAYTDVPAMGDDENDYSQGYINAGEIPQFKVLRNGELINMEGDIPEWSNNEIFMVSSLNEAKLLPEEFSLEHAYPNPFNPSTTINFALPLDSEVSIAVYNLQGREVITLVSGNMDAGYHSVIWNADSHSSGVYFVKMVAGEFVNTQKLMLVK